MHSIYIIKYIKKIIIINNMIILIMWRKSVENVFFKSTYLIKSVINDLFIQYILANINL